MKNRIVTRFNSILDSLENQWYKPYDVGMFSGKRYVTSEGEYIVDDLAGFHSEKDVRMNGCQVAVVAGITQFDYDKVNALIYSNRSLELIQLLANVGRKPKPGLLLAFALSPDNSRTGRLAGVFGGRIIEKPKRI